jgi:hypothetical protein
MKVAELLLTEMAKRSSADAFIKAAKDLLGAEKLKSVKWADIDKVAKTADILIPPAIRAMKSGRGTWDLSRHTAPETKKEEPKPSADAVKATASRMAADAAKDSKPKERDASRVNHYTSYTEWPEFVRALKKEHGDDIDIEREAFGKHTTGRHGFAMGKFHVIDKKTDEVIGQWEAQGGAMVPGRGAVGYGVGNVAHTKKKQASLDARPFYAMWIKPEHGAGYIATGTSNSGGPWRDKDTAQMHVADKRNDLEYDDEFDGGSITIKQVKKTAGGKWELA